MYKCIWPINVQILCVYFFVLYAFVWIDSSTVRIYSCVSRLTEKKSFLNQRDEYSRKTRPSSSNSFHMIDSCFKEGLRITCLSLMWFGPLCTYIFLLASGFATNFPCLEGVEMGIKRNSLRKFRSLLCKIALLEGILDMI